MKEPLRPQLFLSLRTVMHHVHYILAALLFFFLYTQSQQTGLQFNYRSLMYPGIFHELQEGIPCND